MARHPTEVADRLYTLPPDRFVAERDRAVADARAAGDRTAARELAGLRRPTVAAWLVNLLALRCPEPLAELLELGDQLRHAQRELHGPVLRELSLRRRAAITGLAAQARQLAAAELGGSAGIGRPRPDLPLAEVESTLHAALADEAVAEQVQAGRLLRPVSYTGLGELPRPRFQVIEGGAARAAPETPADVAPTSAQRAPVEQVMVGRRTARESVAKGRERAARELAEQVAQRTAELASAQRESAAAEGEYQRAATELAEAEQRLARAQTAVSATLLRRKSAQRAVQAAERALRAAQTRAGDDRA